MSAHVPAQPSDPGSAQDPQPLATKAKEVNCSQQSDQGTEPAPASNQLPLPAAANALSYLMAEQREQSQVMVFFLQHMPDKTWQTHWWTRGPKPSSSLPAENDSKSIQKVSATQTNGSKASRTKAVWSVSTQILSSVVQSPTAAGTGSNKSKVTVQLQTNLAPGSEADLAQMAYKGTFKGSPSLLKSALQKNVRLGRAAPAVR